ncbi:flagellar hook-length control protein FliK [Pannonibacter tanglangensis]|uniref:Flagellar hook-length control protein-like C-terminal domain-containing protein n=1 Tax=Pannonibacter tanglangensis TaxID=2750084 RepID=A0ABW9ZLV1_9HYPH|nr:flagellar hook-length control protein FliK [Pannonibacter sp. XCT-34]NBN64867.1 hypothetical protein [Pannonibacter sp. XCT-34]
MAVSTTGVLAAAAPLGSARGSETAAEDPGTGFEEALRDVAQPRERGTASGQRQPKAGAADAADASAPAATVDPGTVSGDAASDPAAWLRLLTSSVTPAQPPAGPSEAPADAGMPDLAGMLGLTGSLPPGNGAGAAPATPAAATGPGPGAAAGGLPPGGLLPFLAGASPSLPAGAEGAGGSTPANGAPASTGALSGLDDDGLFARFAVAPEEVRMDAATGRPAGQGAGQAVTAEIGEVRVLREETHFAPSLRLSPVEQIGAAISKALAEPPPAPPSPGQLVSGPFTARADGPMVKVLEIQLQPMELGSVKVALRLMGDSVEVVLSAQNPDTVELLKTDRQLLDQMLRAVGQKADSITIQAASDDRPLFQVNGSLQGQGPGWLAQNGDAGAGREGAFARDGSGQGQEGSGRSPQDRQRETEGPGHGVTGEDRGDRSGVVYL